VGFAALKKRKMKSKGKKLYKNTHGKTFRVVRNYKIRHMEKQRETLRKLKAQLGK
jgi:hypothetical protein